MFQYNRDSTDSRTYRIQTHTQDPNSHRLAHRHMHTYTQDPDTRGYDPDQALQNT